MEQVLHGEVDRERAEALEGEQAEVEAEWVVRGLARDQVENAYVPVVERLLPTRWDYPVTSGIVLNAGNKW